MTRATAVQAWKDVRALAPVTLAGTLVVWLGPYAHLDASMRLMGYALSAVAIGASAFGHELPSGVLGTLLAQPVPRWRLASLKFCVLAVMLAGLGLIAATSLSGAWPAALSPYRRTILLLPVLGSLCVAPWLTLLCRSALAGVVFTLGLPAVLWIGSGLLASRVFDFDAMVGAAGAVSDFRVALTGSIWLGLCGIGIVRGWNTFARLEARESAGPQWQLPAWAMGGDGAAARPSHWIWQLVRKELRLQQLTVVLAVMYVAGLVLASWFVSAGLARASRSLLTTFYIGLAALLTGALAIAEERQLRMLETQVLQPISTRIQWAVKLGVTATVAAVCAIGVPLVAGLLTTMDDASWEFAIVPFLLVGAFWVSSVTEGGLRALVWTLPAWVAAVGISGSASPLVSRLMLQAFGPLIDRVGTFAYASEHARFPVAANNAASVVFIGLLVGIAAVFTVRNYRMADRPARRIAAQYAVLIAIAVSVDVAGSAMNRAWQAGYREYRAAHPERFPARLPGR